MLELIVDMLYVTSISTLAGIGTRLERCHLHRSDNSPRIQHGRGASATRQKQKQQEAADSA